MSDTENKVVSLREQILNAPDLASEPVSISEWGIKDGLAFIRGATAAEYEDYESSLYVRKIVNGKSQQVENFVNAKSRLVVKCLVDGEGDPIFKLDDAAALGKKRAGPVARLFSQIQRMSGVLEVIQKEIEGNSATGQNSSSSTSSPVT